MGFPERFSELLETRGITAYKLSKETGFSQALISQWKNGKQVPSADRLMVVADYLGVSMDYLMCRTDRPELHIQEVETEKGTAELRVSKPLTDEEIEKFREMLETMGKEE